MSLIVLLLLVCLVSCALHGWSHTVQHGLWEVGVEEIDDLMTLKTSLKGYTEDLLLKALESRTLDLVWYTVPSKIF